MRSFESHFSSDLQGPDENQKRAAQDIASSSVINAGAGTGKTKTLTLRYVWAIISTESRENPIGIDNILTITYTKIGAAQLVNRVTKQLREQGRHQLARNMGASWVSTIHAFCTRVLRQEALRAQIDPAFGMLEDLASVALKNETFDELASLALGHSSPYSESALSCVPGIQRDDFLALTAVMSLRSIKTKVLSLYAQARSQGVSVRELHLTDIESQQAEVHSEARSNDTLTAEPSEGDTPQDPEKCLLLIHSLAVAFEALYEMKKSDSSVLDFDDLIIKTSTLFDQPEVAQKYRNRFRLIMIDEFQDTNQIQMDLINKIANDNICVVGDRKQSIYRFQGADVSVFEQHTRGVMELGGNVHELFTNYRSHPDILRFINTVFSDQHLMGDAYEALRVPITGETQPLLRKQAPRIGVRAVSLKEKGRKPVGAEAVWIADEFDKLRARGHKASEMVILVAVRTNAPVFERELRSRGFKVQTLGGSTFFVEPFVKTARLLMQVLSNPTVDNRFIELLYSPFGRLGDGDLYELSKHRDACGVVSLWDAAQDIELSDSAQGAALRGVVEAIRTARCGIGMTPVSTLLARAMSERNVDLHYLAGGSEGKRQYATFQKLLRMADGVAKADSSLNGFMEYLDALEDSDAAQTAEVWNEGESDVVRIMTIHNAKGDEYPIVAVPLGYRGKSQRANPSGVFVAQTGDHEEEKRHCAALRLSKDDETSLYSDFAANEDLLAMQEDKRLFYVACTRAKQHLFVSFRQGMERGLAHSFEEALSATCLEDDIHVQDTLREILDYGVIDGDAVIEGLAQTEATSAAPQELATHLAPLHTPLEEKANQFSYSDIASFEKCPRRFHFSFIERFGELSKSDTSSAANKGLAMHLLLEAAQTTVIDPRRADAICRYYGIDEHVKYELLGAVEVFFNSPIGQRVVAAKKVHKEMQFYVPVTAGGDVRYLKGFIDAYCEVDDGRVVVVDYKSGTSKGAQREDYESQAKCYAMVALKRGAAQVEVAVVRPQYLEEDNEPQTFSYSFTQESLDQIENWIAHMALQMDRAREMSIDQVDTRVCSDCQLPTKMCSRKQAEHEKRILKRGV